jgi:predicted nucleic acid-binding protein
MNGMTDSRFVLDTNIVIFLTNKSKIVSSRLQSELEDADLFISVINEIELFAKPKLLPMEEGNLQTFLSDRITVIDLTSDIKEETIAIRRATTLKLPDCIVAATSIALNAILLTDDHHLLNLSWPGLRTQNIF